MGHCLSKEARGIMAELAKSTVVLKDGDTFHIRIPANTTTLDEETIRQIEWCMWRIKHGHGNGLEPVCVAEQDQLISNTEKLSMWL